MNYIWIVQESLPDGTGVAMAFSNERAARDQAAYLLRFWRRGCQGDRWTNDMRFKHVDDDIGMVRWNHCGKYCGELASHVISMRRTRLYDCMQRV